MQKIARSDIKDIAEYERIRSSFRERVISLKTQRRVSLGPSITVVFENRDTVLFQIQEMMRVERIVHEEQIQEEIDAYNSLIPGPDELSATLFIEITDEKRIKPVLDRFIGLDQGEKIWLQFGQERVVASFEQGRSSGEKISAVHFLRFQLTPQQSRRFRSGEDQVFLAVKHKRYAHELRLPDETRLSLAKDLEGGPS